MPFKAVKINPAAPAAQSSPVLLPWIRKTFGYAQIAYAPVFAATIYAVFSGCTSSQSLTVPISDSKSGGWEKHGDVYVKYVKVRSSHGLQTATILLKLGASGEIRRLELSSEAGSVMGSETTVVNLGGRFFEAALDDVSPGGDKVKVFLVPLDLTPAISSSSAAVRSGEVILDPIGWDGDKLCIKVASKSWNMVVVKLPMGGQGDVKLGDAEYTVKVVGVSEEYGFVEVSVDPKQATP